MSRGEQKGSKTSCLQTSAGMTNCNTLIKKTNMCHVVDISRENKRPLPCRQAWLNSWAGNYFIFCWYCDTTVVLVPFVERGGREKQGSHLPYRSESIAYFELYPPSSTLITHLVAHPAKNISSPRRLYCCQTPGPHSSVKCKI